MKFLAAKQPVFKAALILAGAVTLAATGAASAATVSFSDSVATSPLPIDITLNLQQFDPSLGTLTGVEFTFASTATTSVVIYDFSSPSSFTNASASFEITATGPAGTGTTTDVTHSYAVASGTTSGLSTTYDGPPETLSSSVSVSAANFAAYEGLGTLAFDIAANIGNYGGTGPQFFGGNEVADAKVTVEYTYAVAATPLPAALPLFASGLGAMGVLGWRRKRKAKTAA